MKAPAAVAMTQARRVRSMRAELDEATRWKLAGKPGAGAMVAALKKDLAEQEDRLAAMS